MSSLLRSLKSDPSFIDNVTRWEVIPDRSGVSEPFPVDLNPKIKKALGQQGIHQLFCHQNSTYQAVRNGCNVCLVTPSASGKTLSYNLPIVQSLAESPDSSAMYLFPTKALAHDQILTLKQFITDSSNDIPAYSFDGDSVQSSKTEIRNNGRIILTNPDMLHMGILPKHTQWKRFFTGLQFIVIDELHIYRGLFGSHLSNLIRRLRRIVKFYGREPQFVCCSATIGNPHELSYEITGDESILIENDGSPKGEKHFLMYNPPFNTGEGSIRPNVVDKASEVAFRLLKDRLKTIFFFRSRTNVELFGKYLRTRIEGSGNFDLYKTVATYRGGYLPRERRNIEKGFRDGDLLCVASTNALELGIDVGELDASVIVGFPGTIASCWQQAGRAGRKGDISLAIFIASSAPIDQFIVRNPSYFFDKTPESGYVDRNNFQILFDHLRCSVFELPYSQCDNYGPEVSDILSYLSGIRQIKRVDDKWYWSSDRYPAADVSLRSSTPNIVTILNRKNGRKSVLGKMDFNSAKIYLHKDAIYIHDSKQYIVNQFDLESSSAEVTCSNYDYFTEPVVEVNIKVLNRIDDFEKKSNIILCDIVLVRRTIRFNKILYTTHDIVGSGTVDLPNDEIYTRSATIVFLPETCLGKIYLEHSSNGALLIIDNLIYLFRNISPVFLMCDIGDIGVYGKTFDYEFRSPVIYIFDVVPGGVGIAFGFLEKQETILRACFHAVSSCICEYGCPSCIGPVYNRKSRAVKKAVISFLSKWIDSMKKGLNDDIFDH